MVIYCDTYYHLAPCDRNTHADKIKRHLHGSNRHSCGLEFLPKNEGIQALLYMHSTLRESMTDRYDSLCFRLYSTE